MLLNDADRRTLLDAARASIHHGLLTGEPLPLDATDFTLALRNKASCFVTLRIEGALRGCIGSLEPTRPLVEDAAVNSFNAAFHDPRFDPLTRLEFDRLDVCLSILQPPEPMTVHNEADLFARLRPGVDGLTLYANGRRATFLPAVWDTLSDPRKFVAQLKIKAGLSPDDWPKDLRVERYTTEHIP